MMAMDSEYQDSCVKEETRLRIAAGWAQLHRSLPATQFDQGRADRIAGKPCRSANGSYLDGWYSV